MAGGELVTSGAGAALRSRWPNHAGAAPDPGEVYFRPPPELVGEVVSADCTLRDDSPREHGLGGRLMAFLVGGFLGMIFTLPVVLGGIFLDLFPSAWSHNEVFFYVSCSLAAVVGVLGAWLDCPRYTLTYVGDRGLARFWKDRDKVTEALLSFDDVDELRVQFTDHYTNGVYTGRTAEHVYADADGKPVLRLTSNLTSSGDMVRPEEWTFLHAAEAMWTRHKVARVLVTLEAGDPVEFRLGKDSWLILGPGTLEVVLGDQPECFPVTEIAAVRLKGRGQLLEIERPGATRGYFSSTGILAVDVSELGDRQVFASVLSRVVGVDLEVER